MFLTSSFKIIKICNDWKFGYPKIRYKIGYQWQEEAQVEPVFIEP